MMYLPQILFEDEHLLVVSKPAEMVVNRADTTEVGETLQDFVEKYFMTKSIFNQFSNDNEPINQTKEQIFVARSGIAHRLDKETSGVMLIGKNPMALANLMGQFQARSTEKVYLTLVHGILEPAQNIINLPLKRSVDNRHKFRVDVFGKPAITEYRVIESFTVHQEAYQDGFSLVEVSPKTGRTHQIRVHLTHIGHPLVADELYGGRKRTIIDRQWCPRHFLHARKISFDHPSSGERMIVEAPLSADLQKALEVCHGSI